MSDDSTSKRLSELFGGVLDSTSRALREAGITKPDPATPGLCNHTHLVRQRCFCAGEPMLQVRVTCAQLDRGYAFRCPKCHRQYKAAASLTPN